MESTTRIKHKSDLVWTTSKGEVVVMDVEREVYVALNEVASAIFLRCESEVQLEQLIDYLLEMYNVDRATCFKDTVDVLTRLVEQDLIELNA